MELGPFFMLCKMCKVRAWDLGFGAGKRRAGLGQDAMELGLF